MIHPHPGRARRAAALGLLLAAACGGAEEPRPERPTAPRGAQLVAGPSLDEWGILVVPRRGGPASLRSLRDPARVVWTGKTELPAAAEAHALEDGLVLLRAAGGEVYRYDPGTDAVDRAGRAGEGAGWASAGRAGLFLDREGREILAVSRSGSWRYSIPHPVEWASPLEPGAVTLLVRGAGGPEVWVLREGEERPVASLETSVAAPALVTAWGKRIVLVAGGERGALQVLTVTPLAAANRIEVGDPVRALSGSPSTHEIYVALDRPPRLRAVNRFTGSHRDLGRFPRPPVEIRAAPFGDPLLAHDGTATYRLPVGGGDPERLDAEWRSDLPLALPGGRVLFVRGEGVRLIGPGTPPGGEPVEGPADAWWLAVRWSPKPAGLLAGEVRGEPLAGDAGEAAAGGGEPAARGEGAPAATGRPAGRGGAGREPPAGGEGAESETAESEEAGGGPAPGFYAIVGSARSSEGIVNLTRALSNAGYPTAMQAVPDDAGDTWHRGLVGPFRSRGEAEAAARQLERERRLQAWVTEVAGGGARGALR